MTGAGRGGAHLLAVHSVVFGTCNLLVLGVPAGWRVRDGAFPPEVDRWRVRDGISWAVAGRGHWLLVGPGAGDPNRRARVEAFLDLWPGAGGERTGGAGRVTGGAAAGQGGPTARGLPALAGAGDRPRVRSAPAGAARRAVPAGAEGPDTGPESGSGGAGPDEPGVASLAVPDPARGLQRVTARGTGWLGGHPARWARGAVRRGLPGRWRQALAVAVSCPATGRHLRLRLEAAAGAGGEDLEAVVAALAREWRCH